MEKVSKAIARTMIRQIFFGSCVAATPVKLSDRLPTAWTDALSIFYNPTFVDEITGDETEGVFVHEVLHIVLLHPLRRGNRKPRIWNVACDHVINLLITSHGYKLPAGGCMDRRFKGMFEEQVYEQLIDEHQEKMEEERSCQSGQQPDGNAGAGGGGGDEDGDGQSKPGPVTRGQAEDDLERRLAGMDGPLGGDIQLPENLDEATISKIRSEAMGRLSQAVTMSRAAGVMPSDLERLVSAVFEPELPWAALLSRFMTETAQNREDWGRPNRRIQSVFLPQMRDEAMGDFVLIGDTSGSVTDRELEQIAAELTEVSEVVKPRSIRVVWADADVAGEQVFERGEELDLIPQGGGGTNMCVPLEYVEQYDPVVCILVTDGYTPWPEETPPYPLIICCTSDTDVPEHLGEVIRLRAGRV